EVVNYRPDVVIVPLIHNDFDEMYRGLKSRYASSFMKLRRTTDGEVAEVAPGTFRPGLADKLRASAAFRYLYYETNLYIHAKSWINRLYWGGSEEWDPAFISSAVDIRKVNDHESNRFFARYVLREMKALSQEHGFRLIIAMDGVRDAIYDGRKPMDYEIGRLNRIARDLTAELGLTFVDFHDTFARDYALHRKRFEFSYDWHWNERANRLVAETLEPLVVQALRPTVQRKTVMLSSQRMPRVPGLREKPAGAECAEKSKPADQKTAGVSEAPPLPARRKSPQNAEPEAVPDPKVPPTRKIPMRDA
ncbi:MAG: SGNH/GDSL hydrolase family protein, partial [Pseudomonadota bacterium]